MMRLHHYLAGLPFGLAVGLVLIMLDTHLLGVLDNILGALQGIAVEDSIRDGRDSDCGGVLL